MVLLVRRFRCRALRCPARIFAERFPPDVARPHARGTSPLQGLVRHLGLALGGRPAQALAERLLLPVSKDTFLRSVRAAAEEIVPNPRVVGIDDWAWRKGQRYGTLICDLERRQIIDFLPDREPGTVEAWLRARLGIEVVARDRNGGYGGAVSRALPQAIQVADHWHLLENASAAFLAAVQRNMPAIRKAIGAQALDPNLLTAAERLQYEGFLRRQHTNRMVRQMADEGTPIRRIVRLTGLSRGLIRQIVRGEREDVFRIREHSLPPWLSRLEREWAGGCRNGAEPWRRLRADGVQGSLRVVGEWATRQRRAEQAVPSGTGKSPPACKIARHLSVGRNHLRKADAIQVARIEAALPTLATARRLIEHDSIVCPCGCDDMVWIGEEGSEHLNYIPAFYQVVVTVRPRYACPNRRTSLVQAKAPAHLLEGSWPYPSGHVETSGRRSAAAGFLLGVRSQEADQGQAVERGYPLH